VEKLNVKK